MDEIWLPLASYLSMSFYLVLLTAWRALPLGLCALTIDLALHRRVAARYLVLVWMLVAVRLLLPFSLPSSWSMQGPFDHAMAALLAKAETPPTEPELMAAIVSTEAMATAAESTWQPTTSPTPALDRIQLAVITAIITYSLVAAAMLLRSVIAHVRFAHRLRHCPRVEDAPFVDLMLRECDALCVAHRPVVKIVPELSTPAVFGLFRPTICLPADARNTLTEQELRWVLRHELAHVRRRDAWLLAVVSLMRCFHWLNPLAWLVSARVRMHIENAADDLALGQSSAPDAVAYGRLLLRFAEQVSPARPSAALGFLQFVAGKRLRQRIEHATRSRAPRRRWLAVVSTAALMGLAFVGWSDAASEQGPHYMANKPFLPADYESHFELSPNDATTKDNDPVSLRTYDVREVLQRIREVDPAMNAELMLTSLSQNFSPGQPFQLQDERLLASATPRQHEALKQMLEAWRIGGPQQIVIEMRMLSSHQKFANSIDWVGARIDELKMQGPQPAFAAKATDAQLRRFIVGMQSDASSNILFAPKVTLFNGQTATIATETQRPFVTAVKPASTGSLKPIVEVLSEGLKTTVRPFFNDDGSVTLTLDVQVSKIGEVALANLPYGPHDGKTGTTVQVPNASTTSVRGTVTLVKDESVVIAMPELYNEKQPAGAERAVYYSLTPRVLDLKELKDVPAPPRQQGAK